MNHRRGCPGVAILLLLVAVSVAGAARAGGEAVAWRLRAAQLAASGQCEQALEKLALARASAADDARSNLLEGQCRFETDQFAEGLPYLEAANRQDPRSADAAMYLGMTDYELGRMEEARVALERAEALDPERAEVALYQGLVLLELGRHDEASQSFERAAAYGPDRVEPMASYYGGLAHAGAGRNAESEAALRRASRLAPGSKWDREAQAVLAGERAGKPSLRRWLVLRAGIDYDSNVGLIGDDVVAPATVSNRADGRVWWGANGGVELFRNQNWGGGLLANYYGHAYFRETEFNNHFVSGGFWADRVLDARTLLRVRPEAGFSWYDNHSYLHFYGATSELLRDWGSAGDGRFYFRYAYDDYRYRLRGNSAQRRYRDRDGHDFLAGYDHTYAIDAKTRVYGGPYGLYYLSDGREWDHWGIGGWAGIARELPWQLTLRVEGGYTYNGYRNPSSYLQSGESQRDRRDHLGWLGVEIDRPITDWLTATARWRYTNNLSNTDVFDYDRHIAGVYFTVPIPLGN